jgi:hypothetical protein
MSVSPSVDLFYVIFKLLFCTYGRYREEQCYIWFHQPLEVDVKDTAGREAGREVSTTVGLFTREQTLTSTRIYGTFVLV